MAQILVKMRLDDVSSKPSADGSKVYFNATEETQLFDGGGQAVSKSRFQVGVEPDAYKALQAAKGEEVLLSVNVGASQNGKYPRPYYYGARLHEE
jgi:hypothetical protein